MQKSKEDDYSVHRQRVHNKLVCAESVLPLTFETEDRVTASVVCPFAFGALTSQMKGEKVFWRNALINVLPGRKLNIEI